MNFLNDVITYIRRIIKSPSNASITDELLIDYINRFWIMDVDARMQLFDMKTKYSFQTTHGVDQYNMPLYDIQSETPGVPTSQDIGMYPVYQGFTDNCYVNGINVQFHTQKTQFFNIYPNIVQQLQPVFISDGRAGPYTIQLPILPPTPPPNPPVQGILRGHVDITGIIATGVNQDPPFSTTINPLIPTTSVLAAFYLTSLDAFGNNIVVSDSGQFLLDGSGNNQANYGLLLQPGSAPFGNLPLSGGYSTTSNTINYITGLVNVQFPVVIPAGNNINVQCYYFQTGLPRSILYYNNTITLRSVPDRQYLVELDAYLSPCAFFNTAAAIPFAYMAEYIARGASRKILSDTGDVEQLQFYEPMFREQELLVWKRSQRQWTATRTQTIYSQGSGQGFGNANNSSASGTI